MADNNCLPPCLPNMAVLLATNSVTPNPTKVAIDSSCAAPVFVQLCNPSEYDSTILCDPVTGAKVIVTTNYTSAGVPTSTTYNLDGTLYLLPIANLISCAGTGE